MRTTREITFTSFLAGVLLVKRDVGNLEFSELMAEFQNHYNVDFLEFDYDYTKLNGIFCHDSFGLHLISNYTDKIISENVQCDMHTYLYEIADKEAISFLEQKFGIILSEGNRKKARI